MKYSAQTALGLKLCTAFWGVFLMTFFVPVEGAFGHGVHKSQPLGIIDPLGAHHAFLEDEIKMNYYRFSNDDESSSGNLGALELALAISDLVGAELLLPFGSNNGNGSNQRVVGDIETFIPKISFIRKYGFVMTSYVAVRIPTGDESAGLGEPGWGFAPHLLMDYGSGNFGLQANAALEYETEGEFALEAKLSLAYSLVMKRSSKGSFLVSPLLEFAVEAPLNGPESQSVVTIIPGVKIAPYRWHFGLGVELPLTNEKDFDYRALVQVGYHIKWKDFF